MGNQNGHINRQPIQRQTNVFYDNDDFWGHNGDIHRWMFNPKRGVAGDADEDLLGHAGPHKLLNFRRDIDGDLLGAQCDHWENFKKDPKRYGVFLRQRGCPPEGQDVDDDLLGDMGGHSPLAEWPSGRRSNTFRI